MNTLKEIEDYLIKLEFTPTDEWEEAATLHTLYTKDSMEIEIKLKL